MSNPAPAFPRVGLASLQRKWTTCLDSPIWPANYWVALSVGSIGQAAVKSVNTKSPPGPAGDSPAATPESNQEESTLQCKTGKALT